jgi:hypothetical protein
MTDVPHRQDPYRAGRRDGLALGAFALALVSFVHLLGAEKAILAMVLAILAIMAAPGSRFAAWALGVAALYIVTLVTALIVFHDKFEALIKLLQQLS